MGRISGWVSGEFDFEILSVSDENQIFWQHKDVSSMDALEDAYAAFLQKMSFWGNPG
jgi:hypothetical protein